METKNNRSKLADYCHELIDLILKMRINNDFGNVEHFQDKIVTMLNQIEQKANQNSISSQEFDYAKFALIAFIDEMIITSDWVEKETWIANPLQMQIYNRFDAGEEFFKKLNSIKINPKQHSESLEVYFLCLGLGFRGKYAINGSENIQAIISESYSELMESTGGKPKRLSPSPIPVYNDRRTNKLNIPIMHIGISFLVLAILFYIIISFISINAVEDAIISVF